MRRSPARRIALVVVIAFVVMAATLATVFFWIEYNTCHQPIPGVQVRWGPTTPSRSPDGRSHYDNLTFSFASGTYTQYGCGVSPSQTHTISTSNLIVYVNDARGIELQRAGALCGPPANFSSCDAAASGWYAALFDGAPGVLATYPSASPPANGSWSWMGFVAPGTSVEHLSVISSSQLNETGDSVLVEGIGYVVTGYAYL